MIFTRLRNLLAAALCLLAGTQAQAQFSGSADQYAGIYWDQLPVSFSLSEVAAALDADAATFAEDFNAWTNGEKTFDTNLMWLVTPDGAQDDTYTCDNNGFFLTAEGAVANWGNQGVWYVQYGADVDDGDFAILVAQSDALAEGIEPLKAGDVAKANFVLKYNGKEATFAVTFNITAKPEYNIPEPATLVEKDLNIVGTAEVTVEQYPRGDYSSDQVKIEVADLAEKLGIDDANLIADELLTILYATQFNNGSLEEDGGLKMDELTHNLSADGNGFWLHGVQTADGEETGECSAADYNAPEGGTANRKFYLNNFKFDAATNVISCYLGQNPSTLKADEKWYANIYVLYGDKAYRITYNLNVIEKEQGQGLTGLTEVGSVSYEFEQSPAGYSWINFDVDLEAIAAALGCEPGNLDYAMLDDSDNWASKTAEDRGFWISEMGTVTSWGPNARICVLPAEGTDLSRLMVGQMEGTCEVGDVYNASIYFVYGENYYTLNIKFTILPTVYDDIVLDIKAVRSGTIQILPNNDYATEQTSFSINPADVAEAIGSDNPELYCDSNDEYLEESGQQYVWYHTNNYHCDPTPGVWVNADGKAQGWNGDTSPIGICYDIPSGAFTIYQMPNVISTGNQYKVNLYLVNDQVEGAWPTLQVKLTVNVVESLEEKEVVGSESIVLPVGEEQPVTIDLSKPAEALGVTADDLLSANSYYLRGLTTEGVYGDGQTVYNGLTFNIDGGYDKGGYGDIYFYYDTTDKSFFIGSNEEVADDYSVSAQFCFEVDNKQYVYYAKLVSEALYSGISTVKATTAGTKVFDLQGRRVEQPRKGLYIRDGRKVVVK